MPMDKSEPRTDSSATNAASRLFENAYSHLKPGIKFVQEHPAESITAGLVLCSAAAATVALKGKSIEVLGAAGEGALGKNVLGKSLLGKSVPVEDLLGPVAIQVDTAVLKPLAEPVQYRTVAEEVQAFSRNLSGKNDLHDALAHVMTLKNPATVGGEGRAAISESVAIQMIESPGMPPAYGEAIRHYHSRLREVSHYLKREIPTIPDATLRKWFDLSQQRMAENIQRWGGVPKSYYYSDINDLLVKRNWS